MNKFTAILATGRISNLPTVWCNLLIAFLPFHGVTQLIEIPFEKIPSYVLESFIVACLAGSLLYVGGCFLGDAIDVEFDQVHKPERPISQGILNRQTIYVSAAFMLAMGITLPFAYSKFAHGTFSYSTLYASLALAVVIIAYSLWHKGSAWFGLPLIGACRFFLIIFGATIAISALPENTKQNSIELTINLADELPALLWVIATMIGGYTICFASIARSEASPKPISWRKALIAVMLSLPFIPWIIGSYTLFRQDEFSLTDIICAFPHSVTISIALLCYCVWMISAFMQINHNKGLFVSMSLAGFCLLDATLATLFGWFWLFVCLGLFALSLLLQKWAPAT